MARLDIRESLDLSGRVVISLVDSMDDCGRWWLYRGEIPTAIYGPSTEPSDDGPATRDMRAWVDLCRGDKSYVTVICELFGESVYNRLRDLLAGMGDWQSSHTLEISQDEREYFVRQLRQG
jgi:hypothetical protein